MRLRWTTGGLLAAVILLANGCCSMHPGMGPVGACGAGDCGPAVGCRHGSFLSHLNAALTCGSGCGELYWGEWMSDPPAGCDPCDAYGNYTGAPTGYGCGATCGYDPFCWNPLAGLHHLWGYRFANAGYAGGCTTCGYDEVGVPMDYAPMEMDYMEQVPEGSGAGDSRLKQPPLPAPKPDPPQGSAESRQAARTAAPQHAVRPAGYARQLRR